MNREGRPVIAGIGELLWDMLPDGKRAGGAPVNFVYHATCHGAEGYAISAVGRDEEGREIAAELEKNSISSCLATVDYPTGRVMVELKDGIPEYDIIEDVAWDHIPVTPEAVQIVERADAVCFGSLALRAAESRASILQLLSRVPQGAMKFFDINMRQHYFSKELVHTLLGEANVLKCNDEELVVLREMLSLSGTDEECCRQMMQAYGLGYVILTAGSKFSAVYSPAETSVIDTPRVTVADTVGAGDSFSGSLVCSLLKGMPLAAAHRMAVETAAFVCTRHGAWPAYPEGWQTRGLL